MQSLALDNEIYIKDFDGDNDVDLLLPFSAIELNYDSPYYPYRVQFNNSMNYNGIGAIYALCTNDGNGHFTIQEHFYEGKYWAFAGCNDISNDGIPDILIREFNFTDGITDLRYLIGDGKANFNLASEVLISDANGVGPGYFDIYHIYSEDIDNDGFIEVWDANSSMNEVVQVDLGSANQRPAKMSSPTVNFKDGTGELEIFWDLGSDNETSTCDLTYALRIGSATGLGDMVFCSRKSGWYQKKLF